VGTTKSEYLAVLKGKRTGNKRVAGETRIHQKERKKERNGSSSPTIGDYALGKVEENRARAQRGFKGHKKKKKGC